MHHDALIPKEGMIHGCTDPIPMAVRHHNRLPFPICPRDARALDFRCATRDVLRPHEAAGLERASRKLVRFFGTLFVINFSMGVVTGIVQEFHFGMNWSEYSRFMGDIFGARSRSRRSRPSSSSRPSSASGSSAGISSPRKSTASASGLSHSRATSPRSGSSSRTPSCSIRSASPSATAARR